jgi:hypothetical protein
VLNDTVVSKAFAFPKVAVPVPLVIAHVTVGVKTGVKSSWIPFANGAAPLAVTDDIEQNANPPNN